MAICWGMRCSTEAAQENCRQPATVVADVVDAAKHLNRFIMTGWSSEKLEMIDVSQVESRFFVRMKGSYTESLAKVEEVFGTIDAKVVAEVGKEFGFITSKMKEEEYRAKAAQFDNIIGMIPGSLLSKKMRK